MTIDWDALVLAPCQAAFGELVVYTPNATLLPVARDAITLAPLTGIFDEHAKVETVGTDGIVVIEERAVLGMRGSSMVLPPMQGDTLLLRGQTWRVSEWRPDGMGDFRLVLAHT